MVFSKFLESWNLIDFNFWKYFVFLSFDIIILYGNSTIKQTFLKFSGKRKKNFHCQHFRIFKSSQLMSSVHVSHTCHTFFRISCTERWNIQGLIVPKKLIRKFKGIVHYFICFPIPQQRIKAEKDFSYRKKILQLEKKYIAKDLNSLHNQKFY